MSNYIDDQIGLYLTGRDDVYSLLNLDIKDYLLETDYYWYRVTDEYKYRADKMAMDFIGNETYYFFIIWVNNTKTLEELNSGQIIKIPNLAFIQKMKRRMNLERGL